MMDEGTVFPVYCFGKMDRRDCRSVSACSGVGSGAEGCFDVCGRCWTPEEDVTPSLSGLVRLPRMTVAMNDTTASERD